jgi:hypothetical protein
MRCDAARRAVSERMDDPIADPDRLDHEVEAHVQSCASCGEFERISLDVRRALRFGTDEADAGLTARVLAAVQSPTRDGPIDDHRPRRRSLAAVAVFVLCALVAFTVTRGRDGIAPATAEDRADLVARGQAAVRSLEADVSLYELGSDGLVSRHAEGDLTYVAPEGVRLRLHADAGDVEVGVNGETAWRRGDQSSTVRGREPFDAAGWSALELVVPVDAFGRDDAGTGETTVEGRAARVATATVAQVDELLGALRTGGGWRALHPADAVTLWLDAESAVPLRLEVRAAPDGDRSAWAARRGLAEPDGGVLFVAELSGVELNRAGGAAVAAPVGNGDARDLGFVDRTLSASEVPEPAWLPAGMVEYRSGERRSPGADHAVLVRTWTTGRAWLKVSATHEWAGDRLFGSIGELVRPVTTAAGVVYVAEDAAAVAVHGYGIDVIVTGSVGEAELVHVAESLGVSGREMPAWWAESGSKTIDELSTSAHPVLVPPGSERLDGASVSVAQRGDSVEIAITGPGARGARVVERSGSRLPPPEDPDARTVTVRGREGRYSPALGELVWVERDRLLVVSSTTLTQKEMTSLVSTFRWVGG